MRHFRFLMLVWAAWLAMQGAAALGQETISQYLWLASPFAADEAERLNHEVSLSPAQKDAVEVVFRDGSEKIRALRQRHQRVTIAQADAAGLRASDLEKLNRFWFEKSLILKEEIRNCEKGVLSDVASLLTPAQRAEGWEQFLLRRVTRVLGEEPYLPYSPKNCLQGVGLSDDERAAIGPIVEKYEDGLLVIAKKVVESRKEWMEKSRKAGMSLGPGGEKFRDALLVLSVRSLDAIEASLSAEHLEGFQRRRAGVGRGCLGMITNLSRIESDAQVSRVLSLGSLTKEQAKGLQEAASRANEQIYQLVRDEVRWIELQALRAESEPEEEPAAPYDPAALPEQTPKQAEYMKAFNEQTAVNTGKYDNVLKEWAKVVNETLTAEQWDELDRGAADEMDAWLQRMSKDDGIWKSFKPEVGSR